ncbi:hypothetical protein SAMN02746009_04276 [Hymenobacter psychrotolerans DSM 18569]|uniref:Uncharacterized protein n=2 Tax=Hymenobacter psychrotolerans TaxID=344998 RepID=A0A1M7HSD6_9BACT|nr:hypothetical protein SAMN02746009_04276 [Hymenobacter psychrotolerans DSM 18569]
MPYLSRAYLKRTWLVEVSPRKEYGRCYKRLEPGRCVEGAPSTRPGFFVLIHTSGLLMEDITDKIFAYRDCSRHLWNSYFLNLNTKGEIWLDYQDEFEAINSILLEDTVLRQKSGVQSITKNEGNYYQAIRVIPNLGPLGFEALFAPPAQSHTQWTVIQLKADDNDFRFMGFFDWTTAQTMENQYARVRLISSGSLPQYIGYDFLLEAWNVVYMTESKEL